MSEASERLQAPGIEEIREAAQRITGYVRRTPLLAAAPLRDAPGRGRLLLKLENLQVTGSFKARGASNSLRSLTEAEIARGIITASGGNHGLAVAYAGWRARTRAVVFLPDNTPQSKVEKFAPWGAELVIKGEDWDEAYEAALAMAEREGLTVIHPFADPRVIAGQGTVGLEMLEDAPEIDRAVVAIGGGGLMGGVATALKALKPDMQVIGVEPVGAPTLKRSLAAGALVTLPKIETSAGTLAPRRSAQINLDILAPRVDEIVLVTDEEMREAARWLWLELGIAAELSGAAALAALLTGRVRSDERETVCALVCGAGSDGIAK